MPEEIKYAGINTLSHFKEFNDETYAPKEHLHTTGDIEDYVAPVQADWNESDETALSFVKNKTHYTEITDKESYLHNAVPDLSDTAIPDWMGYSHYFYDVNFNIEIGKTYKLTINNTEYIEVCDKNIKEISDEGTEAYIITSDLIDASSNGYLGDFDYFLENNFLNPNKPYIACRVSKLNGSYNDSPTFCVWTTEENAVVSFSEIEINYNQLDEKYIPDTIARVKDITQPIQSDWNQNDPSGGGYVKNKPFGKSELVDITISEVTDQLFDYYDGLSYYSYSSLLPLIIGNEYTLTWDGTTNTHTAKYFDEEAYLNEHGIEFGGGIYGKFVYIGNLTLLYPDYELENTGEDYLLHCYDISENDTVDEDEDSYSIVICANDESETSHTYKLIGKGYVYHTIERKYLPKDSILPKRGVSDGRIARYCEYGNTGRWESTLETCSPGDGLYSAKVGFSTKANGMSSFAIGESTIAIGQSSMAGGFRTTAASYGSVVFGSSTWRATNYLDFAASPTVDDIITAWRSKPFSLSYGNYSVVFGGDNITLNPFSAVFGEDNIVKGRSSFGVGCGLLVNGESYASKPQTAFGKYNIEDTENKYAHIVGNGVSDTDRSNAHTVDWDGNAEYAGDVIANGCGGTSPISLIDTANKTLMAITITQDDSENYISDKTFDEIYSHLLNGGYAILGFSFENVTCNLIGYDSTEITFQYLEMFSPDREIAIYAADPSYPKIIQNIVIISSDNDIVIIKGTINFGTTQIATLPTSDKSIIGSICELYDTINNYSPIFYINATKIDDIFFSTDKTFAEIKTAYESGKDIRLICGNYIAYLHYVSDTQFGFMALSPNDQGTVSYSIININENGAFVSDVFGNN